MNLTGNDIIEKSLVKARVIYPGESIPEGKAAQVFDELLGMLESWDLEPVRASALESFSLIAGQAEYTYGDGGDFDSSYPHSLFDSTFIREDGVDHRCRLKPIEFYRSISFKSTLARPYYFSPMFSYPLAKIFFFPIPDQDFTVFFKADKDFYTFENRTTEYNLPPGYGRAIITNLAIEISPSFGKKILPTLAQQAYDSKQAIISKITQNRSKRISTLQLSSMIAGKQRSIIEGL